MSNIIVEGFGTYGTGNARTSSPVGVAMLSGAWANGPDNGSYDTVVGTLPWDATNPDYYLGMVFGASPASPNGWRRVLPVAEAVVFFSFYYGVTGLPNGEVPVLDFRNASNELMARLKLMSTGGMKLVDEGDVTLAATTGPVIVAEAATHVECKIDTSGGTFELWVAGTQVINASGLTFSNVADVAQFRVLQPIQSSNPDNTGNYHYISHLIVRDENGTTNNDITGDRKVATLFPNADVPGEQGWTARPLHRFGVGILDLTPSSSWVRGLVSTDTDIGANEFTIEGQFRFQFLPSGSNKAVLFGKWDEPNDRRSYQLYLGGPDLENGVLTFRTSTDGQNGTVVNKLQWKFEFVTGRWYHIAMVRSSGNLLLFIDGVQQGLSVADSDTYFAGVASPALGAQTDDAAGVAGNYFQGWQDEFRLSVGVARYTSNFSPPTEGFPRGGSDPQWGTVKWLSSWDNDSVSDDGPEGLALTAMNGADAITPDDADAAYQTIDEPTPTDANFIEAELVAAQGIFTLTALPTDTETVTVGTTDGSTPAVYTFVDTLSTAFDVLIGASVADTMDNLAAAIINGPGEGSVYGTGTTANADVSGEVQPTNQLQVTALTPGTSGNSIASTDTCANGSWGAATLEGGVDIPDPSQFRFERMPPNTTTVDSVTLVGRQWRTEAGTASTRVSFIGGSGGELQGGVNVLGNSPSLSFDTFEVDPDGGGPLSPTTVLLGKFQINRTA